ARIVQAVVRAVPDQPPAGSPAMSDMVFLDGIPSVKIGPGVSRRSHTPNEYILRQELLAGAAAYERIIREYFREEPITGQDDASAETNERCIP
ncbi:MAG: M20 family metallo-hydrolase, partial [bacterium]|nr:M20 family metallo-hydrolase [bacterium]